MESKKILVLLVNYFNEDETSRFIRDELLQQSFRDVQIAVINNGVSNIKTLELLTETIPNVSLYNAPRNLGYAGGAYFGWTEYLQSGQPFPDFVIISNSDIHFREKSFFEKLITKHKDSAAGIIGPSIFSSRTKSEQNPIYYDRITKSKLEFLRLIFSSYVLYFLYESTGVGWRRINSVFRRKKKHVTVPENVYAVHGSFIIFTKSFFNKGGHLNYGSFLFGEEIFFAEQCRLLQLKVICDNRLEIIHNEHATTGSIKSKTSVKYMRDSTNYLLKNFFK